MEIQAYVLVFWDVGFEAGKDSVSFVVGDAVAAGTDILE